MIVLYFDSDMDVTPELTKRYGAKLISMPYMIDGETVYPYQDQPDVDFRAFYQNLRQGKMPTTAALNAEEYKKIFEPDFQAGNEIIYVHLSGVMTCSFDNMRVAIAELSAKYPKAKFYDVDTKMITAGAYYLACLAGEMYLAKKSAAEIVAAVEAEREHVACYFYADNLKFFRRSGRVNGLAAFFGGILDIHPIIGVDDAGKMDTRRKVRGRNQALTALVKYVHELGDDIKNHPFFISHADCPALVERLKKLLHDFFGEDLAITVIDVNPTAGCHCGPDTLGVGFHAIHR